ncbi:MAG: phage head closure protein [Aliihoeflea sp.]|uniref:phage head closure protein n=1 Tax=Aliihoeflea sp. TaxID=2608088 RepID=UPI004033C53C
MSLNPWKPQRVSNMRERIVLKAPGEPLPPNEFGEVLFGPDIERPVNARAEPIKGDEVLAAGGIGAYHELTFHIRYRDDVRSHWTIEWRGQSFNIKAMRNVDERRRFLSIEAVGAA